MKFIPAFLGVPSLALSAVVGASPLVVKSETHSLLPRNSKSWAGTSLHYLHGLDFAAQDAYLTALANVGVKVLEVSAQTQGACVKGNAIANGCDEFEDAIGSYNYYILDLLDATIVKIHNHGMKALISPHNANRLGVDVYGTPKDVYGNTWGAGYMYTKSDAAKAYDNRLSAILNYKGVHSGKVWKDWTAAIMGFDIENEPMLLEQKYLANDPSGWICARAAHMRSVLGAQNPIKIASGGVGGAYSNGANFASWVTGCTNLDVVSVHYYDDFGWSSANFIGQGKGKLVHIEEWTTKEGSNQASLYASDAKAINALGIPWCLWQILPQSTCSPYQGDGNGLRINSGIDVATPIKNANSITAAQDWTGIVY
ncbi:hypothetical protein GQ53DRAFT_763151 [Thozetella sp. PMI_491]|nr:hypothetical protein GQ53DRAFT_763151 [Thozetella sp. PMI_491]